MPWQQNYDPLHGPLSTIAAALPLVVLLGLLALRRVTAYVAALAGLAAALIVAIAIIGMPAPMAARAALFGAAYGFLPIGWIVLNVIFLYRITEERGVFVALQRAITGITSDRRLQLLLIAFCFGAFFEGAAGFGTPVAVTGAMLIGIGFPPLEASALSLIANTAPVAFGALGTPVIALQGVTGLDLGQLERDGRPTAADLLADRSLLADRRVLRLEGHARGVAGDSRRGRVVRHSAVSRVELSRAVAGGHRRRRRPRCCAWARICDSAAAAAAPSARAGRQRGRRRAVVGRPARARHDGRAVRDRDHSVGDPGDRRLRVGHAAGEGLSQRPLRAELRDSGARQDGVRAFRPSSRSRRPSRRSTSSTGCRRRGTAILIAALLTGLMLRYSIGDLVRRYLGTIRVVWPSLLTISAMLALGYTTRYSGEDAILGLAFAHTGVVYPFFAAMLGWLGVAVTGSDTSSNVLFGSLQTITAGRLGLSPVLMAAANSSGGVMGKMIDAQSICVASTATGYVGHEWRILRFVFFHSLALAGLVGLLVLLQQYVFTGMIPH